MIGISLSLFQFDVILNLTFSSVRSVTFPFDVSSPINITYIDCFLDIDILYLLRVSIILFPFVSLSFYLLPDLVGSRGGV